MSQKFIKKQNKNNQSLAYGKYFAQAVYDSHFIGTEELADFIQRQASVRKSDIKAVLQKRMAKISSKEIVNVNVILLPFFRSLCIVPWTIDN